MCYRRTWERYQNLPSPSLCNSTQSAAMYCTLLKIEIHISLGTSAKGTKCGIAMCAMQDKSHIYWGYMNKWNSLIKLFHRKLETFLAKRTLYTHKKNSTQAIALEPMITPHICWPDVAPVIYALTLSRQHMKCVTQGPTFVGLTKRDFVSNVTAKTSLPTYDLSNVNPMSYVPDGKESTTTT